MAVTTAYFDAAAHLQTELIVFGLLAALGAFAIGCIGLGGVIWVPAFIALFPEDVIPASIGVATLFAAAPVPLQKNTAVQLPRTRTGYSCIECARCTHATHAAAAA